MIRRLMKTKVFRIANWPLKLFYKEKYLTGYYFDKSNGMAMGLESNPF